MARKINTRVKVLKDDIKGAGAVVFWSLSGPTDYADLCAAWEEAELPESELMEPPTPSEAIRSAEKDCRRHLPKGFFIRKLDKHTYAVVRETRDSDDAKTSEETYEPVLKVGVAITAVKDRGGLVTGHRVKFWSKFSRRCPGGEVRRALDVYVDELSDRYRTAQDEVALHHLDWWTRKMMGRYCHTVSLGERGKPYYVAPDRMDRWTLITSAIMSASDSHTFNQIPAMRGEDAINAVMAACLREVTKRCDDVYKAIEDEDGGCPLGARALKTKQSDLDKLLEKMESYESLLGPKLDQLREDIEECKATVVEVEMKIEFEAEEKAAE